MNRWKELFIELLEGEDIIRRDNTEKEITTEELKEEEEIEENRKAKLDIAPRHDQISN